MNKSSTKRKMNSGWENKNANGKETETRIVKKESLEAWKTWKMLESGKDEWITEVFIHWRLESKTRQSQKMGWCWQFAFLTDGNNSTNCACQQIVYRKLSHSHTQLCNAYMYTFLRLKVVIRMIVINTHTQQKEIDKDSRIKLQWNEFLVIIYDCFPNWNNFRISDAKGLFSILKNFRNFQPDQRKFSW